MRIGVALPSRLGDGAPGGGLTQRDLIDLAVLADGVMLRITESLLPLVAGD